MHSYTKFDKRFSSMSNRTEYNALVLINAVVLDLLVGVVNGGNCGAAKTVR